MEKQRRCRVLEIDGSNALVQLLKALPVLISQTVRFAFWGRSMELGVSEDMLSRVFDGLEDQLTTSRKYFRMSG